MFLLNKKYRRWSKYFETDDDILRLICEGSFRYQKRREKFKMYKFQYISKNSNNFLIKYQY